MKTRLLVALAALILTSSLALAQEPAGRSRVSLATAAQRQEAAAQDAGKARNLTPSELAAAINQLGGDDQLGDRAIARMKSALSGTRQQIRQVTGQSAPASGPEILLFQDDSWTLLTLPGRLPNPTTIVKILVDPYTGQSRTDGGTFLPEGTWDGFIFPIHQRGCDPFFSCEPIVVVWILTEGQAFSVQSRVRYNYSPPMYGDVRGVATIAVNVPGAPQPPEVLHVSADGVYKGADVRLYVNLKRVANDKLMFVTGGVETILTGTVYNPWAQYVPVTLCVSGTCSTGWFGYQPDLPPPPPGLGER